MGERDNRDRDRDSRDTRESSDKGGQKVHIKRRVKRRRVCVYCADKIHELDHKNVDRFRRFISDRGKINPRRNSGLCAKHQRMAAEAIKRARYIGIIPHTTD